MINYVIEGFHQEMEKQAGIIAKAIGKGKHFLNKAKGVIHTDMKGIKEMIPGSKASVRASRQRFISPKGGHGFRSLTGSGASAGLSKNFRG